MVFSGHHNCQYVNQRTCFSEVNVIVVTFRISKDWDGFTLSDIKDFNNENREDFWNCVAKFDDTADEIKI